MKCARRGEGGRRVFFCKVLSEIYLEPGEWISRGMKGSEVPGKRKKVRFQHIHSEVERKTNSFSSRELNVLCGDIKY